MFLFCNYGELPLDAFAGMNLLVQSNILGDTIECSRLHMGDSSEILCDGEEPWLLSETTHSPAWWRYQRAKRPFTTRSHKKERGFKMRKNKSAKQKWVFGDTESLNIRNIVSTLLLRCKGGMSGMRGDLLSEQ